MEFSRMLRTWTSTHGIVLGIALLCAPVRAHEHNSDSIPDGSYVSPDPLDTILWVHIVFMTAAFGVLYPTGMVRSQLKALF